MSWGHENDQGNACGGHGPARTDALVLALAAMALRGRMPGSWLWLSGGWEMAAQGLALAAQGYRHEKDVLSEWRGWGFADKGLRSLYMPWRVFTVRPLG